MQIARSTVHKIVKRQRLKCFKTSSGAGSEGYTQGEAEKRVPRPSQENQKESMAKGVVE